jgi:2-polyprenyl-3-methyl-5-hydroxy-6-metoxy-1,4-benzoquinol methylase
VATTLTAENKTFEPIAWEKVPCPFCQSQSASLYENFGHKLKFSYLRCDDCTLVYQSPRPRYDAEFVNTAYENYVPEEANEFFDRNGLLDGGDRLVIKSSKLLKEIEDFVPNKGRILDIGCHIGLFCKTANDRGWKATGVDISGAMVKTAQTRFGVDARCGDWTTMNFEHPFDAITCEHVLEHIPTPGDWLTLMRERLSPSGVICISVPNIDSIENRLKHSLKQIGLKKPSEWEAWRTPDHLFEPNEKSFLKLIDHAGLKLLKVETYSHKPNDRKGLVQNFYHETLKLGSKLRFFMRPK